MDCIGLSHFRSTQLVSRGFKLQTVEHFLAACYLAGVTDLDIDIDSLEIPIMDGSALDFYERFLNAGLQAIGEDEMDMVIIQKPSVLLCNNNIGFYLYPDDLSRFTYILDYDHPQIGLQISHFCLEESCDVEKQKIASSRTFGFLSDLEMLNKQGKALGASVDNCIVIDEKVIQTPLRDPNELATHKLLDLLGDLSLLAKSIRGHIVAVKTGHANNVELVKVLDKLTID